MAQKKVANMENFKLLYEFSKARHEDQISRNEKLDQKAGILLSFNIALIGLVGLFITDNVFSQVSEEYIRIFLGVLTTLFLLSEVITIILFIKVLQLKNFESLDLNKNLIEKINDDTIEKNFQDFSKRYLDCYISNKRILVKKAEEFETALGFLMFSSVFLTILLIISIYNLLF